MSDIPVDIIQKIIKESQEPVIFKNVLRKGENENVWRLFRWNLEELAEILGDMKLPFRVGVAAKTSHPQWEYACDVKHMTMHEFLNESTSENNTKWYYFDYKYMHEWFEDKLEILNSIDWRSFGFNASGRDSVMWIGNKAAHTICHQDSYGCNLIAQIHGRKQWILYPPNAEYLNETRVPYEESTIYSRINFFSPSARDIVTLKLMKTRPRIVILYPGDVLFVPHSWWHYVESLDISLSINMWIPMKNDCSERLGEALVKLVINRIGDHISTAKDEPKYDLTQCIDFIKLSLQECKQQSEGQPFITRTNVQELKSTLGNVFVEYEKHMKIINEMSVSELEQFLEEKKNRFSDNLYDIQPSENNQDNGNQELINAVINAFSHTDVINKVIEILTFETFQSDKI